MPNLFLSSCLVIHVNPDRQSGQVTAVSRKKAIKRVNDNQDPRTSTYRSASGFFSLGDVDIGAEETSVERDIEVMIMDDDYENDEGDDYGKDEDDYGNDDDNKMMRMSLGQRR